LTNLDYCLGGYGTTFIENESHCILQIKTKSKYNLNFNVRVVDCEGFLEFFI